MYKFEYVDLHVCSKMIPMLIMLPEIGGNVEIIVKFVFTFNKKESEILFALSFSREKTSA